MVDIHFADIELLRDPGARFWRWGLVEILDLRT